MSESLLTDPHMANLVQRSFPIVTSLQGRLPSTQDLQDYTQSVSPEFATTVLYQAILHSALHSSFIKHIRGYRDKAPPTPPVRNHWEVIFVPSEVQEGGLQWGYVMKPLRVMARAWGYGTEEVKTLKSNTISQNARVLGDELENTTASNVILISHGRGSAEVRLLLQNRGTQPALKKVRCWVNISGAAKGCEWSRYESEKTSRIAKTLQNWKYSWKGENALTHLELSSANPIWQSRLRAHEDLFIVNVCGFPVASFMPPTLARHYKILSSLGPNDGVVLLDQALMQPGVIFPIWGMSHLAEPELLHSVMARLWQALPLILSNKSQPTVSRDTPTIPRDLE